MGYLIVPLGHSPREIRGEWYSDKVGAERISIASRFAAEHENVGTSSFGFFSGVDPNSGVHLGRAMERTLALYRNVWSRVHLGADETWGIRDEVVQAFHYAQAYDQILVFVTSWYEVPRLKLLCQEIFSAEYEKRMSSFTIFFLSAKTPRCAGIKAILKDVLLECPRLITQWARTKKLFRSWPLYS